MPTEILRKGAQQTLAMAAEAATADWIETHRHLGSSRGHRQVVRNGDLPEQSITPCVGPVKYVSHAFTTAGQTTKWSHFP